MALAEYILPNLKSIRAEVDEQSMLNPRRLQISEHLSHMLVGDRFGSLQLDDQAILHQQVGEVFADLRAIFVINLELVLLLHIKPGFVQPMRERVLINFFEMPVGVINGDSSAAR